VDKLVNAFWNAVDKLAAAGLRMAAALRKALLFVRSHSKEGMVVILLVVLCTLSTAMSGDAAYNFQSVLMTYYRLAQLLLWAVVCGWLNDHLHGERFNEIRDEISRDPVRAYGRTAVLCALIISGALLIDPV
jgi:uncharacterized membrane protein